MVLCLFVCLFVVVVVVAVLEHQKAHPAENLVLKCLRRRDFGLAKSTGQ